jgi:hypothetical protein
VALLLAALRREGDALRAASICSDVKIRSAAGEERDAIRIELEAPHAEPLVVLVPYADRCSTSRSGCRGSARLRADAAGRLML